MKFLTLVSLFLIVSSSFAATSSIDKCVDAALMGARTSLATNEQLDAKKLYVEEAGMLINNDYQYLNTRKELEILCRRLYISTVEIAE